MPLLLRKIRLDRWLSLQDEAWIPQDDVQGDPLVDLGTKEGKLSVWTVEDDQSNLWRVVAALASNCHTLSNLDYAIFDEVIIGQLGLQAQQTNGNSRDDEANAKWHRDLVELSAGRLAVLVRDVYRHCEKKRVPKADVTQLLVRAIEEDRIQLSRLDRRLSEKIAPRLSANRPELS